MSSSLPTLGLTNVAVRRLRTKSFANAADLQEASHVCSNVLKDTYLSYVKRHSTKLQQMSTGSKQWRRIVRSLLHKKTAATSIPPLYSAFAKVWVHEAQGKTNLIANTMSNKFTLPTDAMIFLLVKMPIVTFCFCGYIGLAECRRSLILVNLLDLTCYWLTF